MVFGAQAGHSQGNGDDAGATKAERVVEFMRCRTRSCHIEDRPAPYDASFPCGIEDRVGDRERADADEEVVWSRSARGPWRCWRHGRDWRGSRNSGRA